ncbi:MAG: hypothetical protein J0647_01100, partial [Campylobacteraceae bacterium]|nr:hypothetical protein [Campylobacteraceae bacterium]
MVGSSSDFISGGAGQNIIYGGKGSDTVSYEFITKYSNTFLLQKNGIYKTAILGNFTADKVVSDSTYESIYNDSKAQWILNNGSFDQTAFEAAITLDPSNVLYTQASGVYQKVLIDPVTNERYANDSEGVIVDLARATTLDATSANYNSYNAQATTVITEDGIEQRVVVEDKFVKNDIENVTGSKYNDSITGTALNNTLKGMEGNDVIDGNGGVDVIDGGAGNDYIYSHLSELQIDGGSNVDTVDFSKISKFELPEIINGIEVQLAGDKEGSINVRGGEAALATIVLNVENIVGTNYSDHIVGDDSDNKLIGNFDYTLNASLDAIKLGGDTLDGGKGVDQIIGDSELTLSSSLVNNVLVYSKLDANNLDNNTMSAFIGGDDIIYGGDGNDIIDGDAKINIPSNMTDVLINTSNNHLYDYIVNSTSGETLGIITGGNDTISGGGGDDILDGGSGLDTVDYRNFTGNLYVDLSSQYALGDGVDTLKNIENIIGSSSALANTLIGDSFSNTIIGSYLASDTLSGLDGNDVLDGRGYNNPSSPTALTEYVQSKDWADYRYVDASNHLEIDLSDYRNASATVSATDRDTLRYVENIFGSNQADIFKLSTNTTNTIIAGGGNDTFLAQIKTTGQNFIYGGGGSDTIDYQAYGDSGVTVNMLSQGITATTGDALDSVENIYGSSGNDTITGDDGSNIIVGRLGKDILNGGKGDDIVYGDNIGNTNGLLDLSNTLIGGEGNDTLYAGEKGDTLSGGLGNDLLTGASGSDTADYSVSASAITVNLSTGLVIGEGSDTLTSIEKVIGTSQADTMTGGNASDTLIGGSGGSDLFFASKGSDVYYGGNEGYKSDTAKDKIDYSSLNSDATVDNIYANLAASSVILRDLSNNSLYRDLISNIENLTGMDGNDTILGSNADNSLFGDTGNDILYGGLGNDTLDGGYGQDTADYSYFTTNGIIVNLSTADYNAGGGTTVLAGTVYAGVGDVDILKNIEKIIATQNSDTIIGSDSADTLSGGDGADTIKGGIGNDSLYGESGNDTLFGGSGDDTLDGGDGSNTADYTGFSGPIVATINNDTLYSGTVNGEGLDTLIHIQNITGSNGNDTITGNDGINILSGGSGNDSLFGNDGADTLLGGSGNDTLDGGYGADVIDGGADIDVIDYSSINSGSDHIAATSNGSTISVTTFRGASTETDSISNIEVIKGSMGNDTIVGGNENNTFYGNSGDDILKGYGGSDTLDGGSGIDTADYSDLNTKIILNLVQVGSQVSKTGAYAGTDSLNAIEIIKGSSANDTMSGDDSTNTLYGSSGDDSIYGLDGADRLWGDNGADYIDGGLGADTIYGGADNDTIFGKEGNDSIYGDDGDDTLYGGLGDDVIDGGNDGTLSDVVSYQGATSSVTISLKTGVATSASDGTDTISNVENVVGSGYDDTITGKDSQVNTLMGMAGNDTFNYDSGNDTLYGGSNTADSGIDTIDYTDSAANAINANLATGIIAIGSETDTVSGIENILGTNLASGDTIKGDANNNIINGQNGNDTLYGGDGNDTLIGGNDTDTVDLSSNATAIFGAIVNLASGTLVDEFGKNDVLSSIENFTGSKNNDTIFGSSGTNVLDGYTGIDIVDYTGTANNLSVTLDGSNPAIVTVASGLNDTIKNIENFRGGSGDDTITGKSGEANTLYGGAGNDTLTGNLGGNGAHDLLDGESGTNSINYSAQTIALTADLTQSKIIQTSDATNYDSLANIQNIYTGSGNDTLIGDGSINIMDGGSGNDSFKGGAGADTLYGQAGNDTFFGGSGNDTFYGGNASGANGIDTADYTDAIFKIDADLTRGSGQVIGNAATEGTDTLYNVENITGSTFDDTIIGNANVNILHGGTGADTLKGGSGVDTLYGDAGNDIIIGGLDGDVIDGGANTNTVDYSSIAATSIKIDLGTAKANYTATPLVYDTLNNIQNAIGGSADDTLLGASGTVNTLFGRGGNDTLTGNFDGDLLDGETGTTDTADYSSNTAKYVDIYAQKIAASLADLSNSTLSDTFTNIEIIKTGSDNDVFTLTGSNDSNHLSLNGTGGTDTIDYGGLTAGNIIVDLVNDGTEFATVTVNSGAGNDFIANIQNITGSQNGDTITGSSVTNIIHGNSGNDLLNGDTGADTIYGDAGADTIIGTIDNANDSYDGGSEIDTIDYTTVIQNLTLATGTTVSDTVNSIGTDSISNIEIFKSGSGADQLTAGSSAMTIYGYDGADTITGGSGDDVIYGGNGWNATSTTTDNASNKLVGGSGDDKLYAGDSGDTLIGGSGDDRMYGGAGADLADYSTAGALTATLATNTVIGADGALLELVSGDGADYVDIYSIETLQSGGGADLIYGANDVSAVMKTIKTGANNDQIYGGSIAETLYGEAGNDTIKGGGGIDTIYAGVGNDLIYGALDGDIVHGDDGLVNSPSTSDTLDFSDILSQSLRINMTTGIVVDINNTLNSSTFHAIENITGGFTDDQITGDDNANILKGGSGNDTIFVSKGADTIDGGIGIDTMDFSSSVTAINVNLATLQILDNGNNSEQQSVQYIENIIGGNVNDTIYGDGLQNTLYGGLGGDTLKGGDNNDILYADIATIRGNDTLSNTLYGEAGNDSLYGAAGADILDGGLGNDYLDGRNGGDIYYGGGGDDVIYDSGTTGNDTLSYATSAKAVTAFALADGTIEVTDGTVSGITVTSPDSTNVGTDTLAANHGIEMILGSGLNDKFFTQLYRPVNEAFILDGGSGNDSVYGGALNDTVFGGANDDVIRGYGGNNVLAGGSDTVSGSGWDTLDYTYDTNGVKINLNSGQTVYGTAASTVVHLDGGTGYGAGTDSVYNFAVAKGGSGTDTITGNSGVDVLYGNSGDDWIVMTTGNDTIYGGANTERNTIDYTLTGAVTVDLANKAGAGAAGQDYIENIKNVSGSMSDDTIIGDNDTTGLANTLIGRAGNDVIYGGDGNDTIYGDDNSVAAVNGVETGTDYLFGGAGNDVIYGGLGNDRFNLDYGYAADIGTNIFYGGAGNDAFGLQNGSDTVYGGAGTDTASYYYGVAINANLAANAGYATIVQGATTDTIFTDAINGVETLGGTQYADVILGSVAGSSLATIYGYDGNDVITGNSALLNEYIDGGDDNDTLKGGGGADTLLGGAGNDLFYGNTDGDTITGGETTENGGDSIDFVDVGTANLDINMTAGTVKISGDLTATVKSTFTEIENIIGGAGSDTIVGDERSNYLYGAAGDDTLKGGTGSDYLDGGSHTNGLGDWVDYLNDGVTDTAGVRVELQDKGWQTISATRGTDYIINVENVRGTDYNDIIIDDSGAINNSLLGMAGDDTFFGIGGNNYIDGGTNVTAGDTVSYIWTNGANLTLDNNGDATAVITSVGTDTLKGIENISGSNSSNTTLAKDIITGNESTNTIWGNTGDDTINGAGGADIIFGGSDNDVIYGGTGPDTIDGGAGNDNLYGNSNVATDSAGTKNTLYGGSGYDVLHGGLSGDILYGDSSAGARSGQGDWLYYDLLSGLGVHVDLVNKTAFGWSGSADTAANDTIGGIDNVYGSNQADYIQGTASVETIYGSGGNDTISGAGGADSLYGDAGDDTLIFTDMAEFNLPSVINGGANGVAGDTILFSTHTSNEILTQRFSDVEVISLASGAFSYTLNVNNVSVVGTTTSDTIIGGIGYTNTINTAAGDDTITFAVDDLLGDYVDGGAHAVADKLILTGSTAITDNQFTNVSNIETLDLTGYSGTTITLGTSAAHAGNGLKTVNLATTYTPGTNVTLDASSFGDGLSVFGGTGSDDVIVVRGQTITVAGSSGTIDILEFKDAGTVDSSNFKATITGIEQIKFSSLGVNNITLDASDLSTANGNTLTLLGGSNADTFNYSIGNLTSADSLDGNSGIDTINFLNSGAIDNSTGAIFGGVAANSIEVIQLNNTLNVHNTLTMGTYNATINGGNQGDIYNYSIANLTTLDTIIAGTGNDTLAIIGSGTYSDSGTITNLHDIETLDLNAFTGTYAYISSTSSNAGFNKIDASTKGQAISLDVSWFNGSTLSATTSAGYNDTITATTFYISNQTLNAGVGGTDTLVLSSGSDLTDGMFANKTNFEVLTAGQLSNNNTITLGSNAQTAGMMLVDTTNANTLYNRTIDIHNDAIGSSDTARLTVKTYDGTDTIIVNDSSQWVSINGASGTDTLKFFSGLSGVTATTAGVIGNVKFSNMEIIQLADGANDVTFDISALGTNMTLVGGSGGDIFESAPANLTTADTIDGKGGNDTLLYTTNSNAINTAGTDFAHLSSIEYIQLANGGNTVQNYNYTIGTLLGGSGNDIINVVTGDLAVKIDGGSSDDVFSFLSASNLRSATTVIGNNGTDTLVISGANDILATDFAKVATVEKLDITTLDT